MKVLFVTSEIANIKKFGGLGDFSYGLPRALSNLNIDIDVIMPYYLDTNVRGMKIYKLFDLYIPFKNKTLTVSFMKSKLENSDVDVLLVYFLSNFDKNELSEKEFYLCFTLCVNAYIMAQFNTYDLIHGNDWHTGLIPNLLENSLFKSRPKTLLTIHNLSYQGESDVALLKDIGSVPGEHTNIDYDTQDGKLNMLYQGISSFDYINTVSNVYKEEILSSTLEGDDVIDALKSRKDRFFGILNGVDYTKLPRSYDINSYKKHKKNTKTYLQNKLNLPVSDVPIFAFISRLDPHQKGLDILFQNMEEYSSSNLQFVLLGQGDPIYEDKFAQLAKSADNISVNIEFNESLALSIFAASDFFLIPSKYEPCGLTQMMSMWYGSLPIAHAVGGLKETIDDKVTGFLFSEHSVSGLSNSIDQALAVYNDRRLHHEMITKAMNKDFSWEKSALEYKDLYIKALAP